LFVILAPRLLLGRELGLLLSFAARLLLCFLALPTRRRLLQPLVLVGLASRLLFGLQAGTLINIHARRPQRSILTLLPGSRHGRLHLHLCFSASACYIVAVSAPEILDCR